jgi:hypothetical protein
VIRHDAHTDLEIFSGHGPEDPDFQGMDFPLPPPGNPTKLTLGMLVKISFVFGMYILLIRLIGLASPDAALILSYVFTAAFGIAFSIKWFAPERGTMEWPVWLGAAVVLFFAAERVAPGVILDAPLSPDPESQWVIPRLLQFGIILIVIVICLSPTVKNLLITKTPGPLASGAVGCLVGGRFAALSYFPQTDFSAWGLLAMLLILVWVIIILITDQYVRFEKATNPGFDGDWPHPGRNLVGALPRHFSLLTLIALPICLWIGNTAFLMSLHLRHANAIGFFAFVVSLAGIAALSMARRTRAPGMNPVLGAWNALTFWMSYNLQRNANPNVYQCVPWFREPMVRFGLVATAIMGLGLALLHLSGLHAPGRKDDASSQSSTFLWRYSTPQYFPSLVEKLQWNADARATYDQWSYTLAISGDAPLPPRNPVRTVGDFLFSLVVFFVGAPLLFIFLLVTTQGPFIASQVGQTELTEEEY